MSFGSVELLSDFLMQNLTESFIEVRQDPNCGFRLVLHQQLYTDSHSLLVTSPQSETDSISIWADIPQAASRTHS